MIRQFYQNEKLQELLQTHTLRKHTGTFAFFKSFHLNAVLKHENVFFMSSQQTLDSVNVLVHFSQLKKILL